jgi:hypothetical protein
VVAGQGTGATQEVLQVTGAGKSENLAQRQQQAQLSQKQRLQLLKSYNKQKRKEQQHQQHVFQQPV